MEEAGTHLFIYQAILLYIMISYILRPPSITRPAHSTMATRPFAKLDWFPWPKVSLQSEAGDVPWAMAECLGNGCGRFDASFGFAYLVFVILMFLLTESHLG